MATKDTFEKLKELQDILVEKYKLEAKVEDAPKRLGTQEALLARLKKEFIEKNTEYDEVKNNVSKLKFELDEAQRARENGEKGMDNITTHREYEALEKQINEASAKESEVRKELQKEEKRLEEINEALKLQKEMIDRQENDLASQKASLDEDLNGFNNQLSTLQDGETELSKDLDPEILFKFQRIIQRNEKGIVAVKNGVCTGCHMILPAQFANDVRDSDDIKFCPYCSRILFYEETEEELDESYFRFNEAGSLYDDDNEEELDEDEREEREERRRNGEEDEDNYNDYNDDYDEESDDDLNEDESDDDDSDDED